MRKTLIFICFPMILFGQINLKEIAVQNDCHMCPGKLVVQKNNLSDTLILGSWGKLPNYELIKSGNKEYLFVESDYLSGGIFIGLGLIIYVELSYAAIKYENYAEQFKPAGLDISLLTNAQRKSVSKTLRTLFVSYLINLAVILFITFIIAEIVININKYLATSDGQIQDSIELQGPYGIVFTSLLFFLLLGIIRMFIGPDNKMKEA